jgi:TldD protein
VTNNTEIVFIGRELEPFGSPVPPALGIIRAMSMRDPSRREFLATAAVGGAALLLPKSGWALPKGARSPAPKNAPATAQRAAEALAASPVTGDEAVALAAIEAARAAGASYADARLVLYRDQKIEIRDDHVERVTHSDEYGIGVRVVADGGWGFAATPLVNKDAAVKAAKTAVETAKRNGALLAKLGKPLVELVAADKAEGSWVSPHEIDPFAVPLPDKAQLLIAAAQRVLETRGVKHAKASVSLVGEDRIFVSSEGAKVHQISYRVEPSLSATAVSRRLGLFASRDLEVAALQAGWEYVTEMDLVGAAQGIGEDVLRKLHAPPVEPGMKTVILAPSNLWLTIHESIGHPTELDRARGLEANFAGTSFIGPDDDRTLPGGLATVGWDDDGVKTGRWDIVREGKFVGWQTTRDQAGWVGEKKSRACSYGQGYDGVAFQRMPNVSLQPGDEGYTTEDLINATKDGVLISGRGSWSIDHQRLNFQFSGQMFWEIKKGRIKRALRDVAYQANTLDFWKSCDMVGGEGTYRLDGTFGDGKGEPSQINACSHGCPPARFKAKVLYTGNDR